MKRIIAIALVSAALPLSGAALAQDMPGWPTNAACSQGDDWCPRYEQRIRFKVSGVWPTLPPDVREACIAETEAIEKSYRLLYDCLANKMQEHIKGQARHNS